MDLNSLTLAFFITAWLPYRFACAAAPTRDKMGWMFPPSWITLLSAALASSYSSPFEPSTQSLMFIVTVNLTKAEITFHTSSRQDKIKLIKFRADNSIRTKYTVLHFIDQNTKTHQKLYLQRGYPFIYLLHNFYAKIYIVRLFHVIITWSKIQLKCSGVARGAGGRLSPWQKLCPPLAPK